ncbi:MAG: hypothetical protein V7754_06460 [Halioglobus sp.]
MKIGYKKENSAIIFRLFGKIIWLVFISACTGGGGGGTTLTTDEQGADPIVLEVPVAYIKRPLPETPNDLRDPLDFHPGAELFVRSRSAASAEDIDISKKIAAAVAEEEGIASDQLLMDIKDIESSYDGNTLIFAARVVEEPLAANLDATTWNLWTLDLESMQVQYLIPSRIKRNEGIETGGGHDIAPHYLTDDRIVFSSTRQVANQARQLNENRSQIFSPLDEDGDHPAAVLHIYDPQMRDAEFQQISFNLSHDLDPTVLSSGEIVFSRWNNSGTDHISLFRITPAGLSLSPLYGFHSQNTGSENSAIEFSQPRELDDGRLAVLARSYAPESFGGNILLIDADNYAEIDQATRQNEGGNGPGQEPLTTTEIRTDALLSRGGQFGSVYPLRDGSRRLLVTWSDCRVIDSSIENTDSNAAVSPGDYQPCKLQQDNSTAAPPLYGAWIYDPRDDTQLPVVIAQEGFLITEIVAAEPRAYPDIAPQPQAFNGDLALQGKGQLLIDSVYDLDGVDISPMGIARHAQPGTSAYRQRPARFLRVVQPVPIPDREVLEIPRFAFGVSTAFSFREILGYVPVEPDGSVTVNVSADRPFTFSVLNAAGRRIGPSHNYWLQLAPGEVLHCTGCHDDNSGLPHGRPEAQPTSANPGARALNSGATGFPATLPDLFATAQGQTMAEVWNFQRPARNEVASERKLSLSQSYTDQWSAADLTPDESILDRDYDPLWTDIGIERAIIVDNLDPDQPDRIVINYIDHIQPIWERSRLAVTDAEGNDIDRCTGCHSSPDGMTVASGQLDLTSTPSLIEANHYQSYRELLAGDLEQWINNAGTVVDRQRICTTVNAEGDTLTSTSALPLASRMRAGAANASQGFFSCFGGGMCGTEPSPPLPDNCIEDGGTPVPATSNTINHVGMLSPSELRLLSEWLDIGAQYYNNPFDARLSD